MIEKGTIVRAWDANSGKYTINFYLECRTGEDFPHIVSRWSDGRGRPHGYKHVKPLNLMPELPEGVKIGDECEFSNNGTHWCRAELVAITERGEFIANVVTGNGLSNFLEKYALCRPIPRTETRVKKVSECFRLLEDNGYWVHTERDRTVVRDKDGNIMFPTDYLLRRCGKVAPKEFPAFLTEAVEV